MRRSPERGVHPVYAAARREECVRHTPQAVERRSAGIRRRPPGGEPPAFAAAAESRGRRE